MKLYYFKDSNKPLNFFQTNKQIEIPDDQHLKSMYGLWVSNVLNIDMPTIDDVDVYKEKVKEIFKTCHLYHINTVFFQVRTTSDAFYKSELNPYSRYLTGTEGKEPPFDVFQYVIDVAKKENISLHAWCNPYRVSMQSDLSKEAYLETCADLNFAKKHPEYLVKDKRGQFILNPAEEDVKRHIIDSMIELVKTYDVDGIHFDDYFYPYGGLDEHENDLKSYEQYKLPNQSIDDFRRAQVTDVVKRVHHALKSVDKNLRFGISPFGIWKNQNKDIYGSHTDLRASESYHNEYADSVTWVKLGYVDYICPQIYWEFGHQLAPFADIVNFWVEIIKNTNVDLYIGHAPYRLGTEGEFENPNEIVNQLKYCNQFEEIKGHVFFTYHTFIDSGKTEEGMRILKAYLNKGEEDEKK
jgi:uncharacterized lipoprotein YddW (UPF0748 family)